MEIRSWAREQNKAIFLKQAQCVDMIKLKV